MNKRIGGFGILVVSGFAFLTIVLVLLWSYGRPHENWINAGPVTDYPPSESPYLIRTTITLYIVNIRGDLIALDAKDPHRYGHIVNWHLEENRFIDPNTGSNYWMDGSFDTRFLPDGPEPMNLERLPLKIQDGTIWILMPGTN